MYLTKIGLPVLDIATQSSRWEHQGVFPQKGPKFLTQLFDGSHFSELSEVLTRLGLQDKHDQIWKMGETNSRFEHMPLWHRRKWKSGSTRKRDLRQRYRPTGKSPLCRYETTGQLLHSEVGSNQVGYSCTWQRSLSCETNTGATEGVPALNQGWRGCNHPTSNWPYQGHQIPYLVPRTTNWLSPLWSNTDHWPYAAGVCIVTGMSWWILHCRLVECSLRDNSWDLHSRIPARSGILLSDMM